jgi:hypothetical protein
MLELERLEVNANSGLMILAEASLDALEKYAAFTYRLLS